MRGPEVDVAALVVDRHGRALLGNVTQDEHGFVGDACV